MTEQELFCRIDEAKDEIRRLISHEDEEGLFSFCHSRMIMLYSEEDEDISKMIVLSEIIKNESTYREHGFLNMLTGTDVVDPIESWGRMFDSVSFCLYRIENEFSEDCIFESIEYFISNDISADCLTQIADDRVRDKEKVMSFLAGIFEEESPVTSIRIYQYLQGKYDNPAYILKPALIYLSFGNKEAALELLKRIKNGGREVLEMIAKLENS